MGVGIGVAPFRRGHRGIRRYGPSGENPSVWLAEGHLLLPTSPLPCCVVTDFILHQPNGNPAVTKNRVGNSEKCETTTDGPRTGNDEAVVLNSVPRIRRPRPRPRRRKTTTDELLKVSQRTGVVSDDCY